MTSVQQLERWMRDEEHEHLEFKEAKNNLNSTDLLEYCAALANEHGGKLLLGVTNKKPRRVVGSNALQNAGTAKKNVYDKFNLRIEIEEINHPNGRVVIVHIPGRPVGTPLHLDGRYLMRSGESLVPMSADQLQTIFTEREVDYSSQIHSDSALRDLDPVAIERFRTTWIRKTGNAALSTLSHEHLLSDAGLVRDGGITVAAVVLLAATDSMSRLLPQAEIAFEWRDSPVRIEYQDRREFRSGFFLIEERLWETISARNTVQQFQEGLFRWDVPTFNEGAVREAIANAVCHRDYRSKGSILIRQNPSDISIVSPGGFPAGITPENIISKQMPRNRTIAEALQKSGVVERSGQGVDLMFDRCIREGKHPPDFSLSDAFQVEVILRGTVDDPQFLRFLEKVANEKGYQFAVFDLVVLDRINRQQPVPDELKPRMRHMEDNGIVERVGAGRGTRYILSKSFYDFIGKSGTYTRRRGLDRETNKQLLLRHIERQADRGSSLSELGGVLPDLTSEQVKKLVQELKREGRVRLEGARRGARWFPGGLSE